MKEFIFFIAMLVSPEGDIVDYKVSPYATYSECNVVKEQMTAIIAADLPGFHIQASCFSSNKIGDAV